MIPLPKWLQEVFKKSNCPYCKIPLDKKGVYGYGLHEEIKKGTKKTKLCCCYNYRCPKCDNRSVFTGFPTNYEDFVADILEMSSLPFPEMEEDHRKETLTDPTEEADEKKNTRSSISQNEVDALKKILNASKTYEEFLSNLGIVVWESKIQPAEEDEE